MNCPKCDAEMARVAYETIEVNRCTACAGLWFDMLELEHLTAIEGSAEIDIGDPAVGKSFDSVDRIECSVCKTRMVRMVDSRQPHIHYESCSACYGIFLDAGELRDYEEVSIFDFFRSLFSKERT